MTEDGRSGLEICRQAAHGQRYGAVRRPVSVRNPLHDIAIEPFELAGHRGCRSDVDGALGRTPVDDGRAERDDYGIRDTHDLARRWPNRSDRETVCLV